MTMPRRRIAPPSEQELLAYLNAVPPPPPPPPDAFDRVAKPVCEAIGTGIGYLLLWGLGTAAIAGMAWIGCTVAFVMLPQARAFAPLIILLWAVTAWLRFLHSTIGCHKHL